MKCIDTDGNGKIELNEFLVAFQDEIGYGHGKNYIFFCFIDIFGDRRSLLVRKFMNFESLDIRILITKSAKAIIKSVTMFASWFASIDISEDKDITFVELQQFLTRSIVGKKNRDLPAVQKCFILIKRNLDKCYQARTHIWLRFVDNALFIQKTMIFQKKKNANWNVKSDQWLEVYFYEWTKIEMEQLLWEGLYRCKNSKFYKT